MDGQIRRHVFGNGITLLGDLMDGRPAASFCIAVRTGFVMEPEDRLGLTSMLVGMLMRRTRLRGARDLSNALDSMGLHRGEAARSETVQFSGALPAAELFGALRLYAEILRDPDFEDEDLAAERQLANQAIASLDDRPSRKVMQLLRRRLILSAHGRLSLGDVRGVNAVTCGDLRSAYSRGFRPAGVTIAVAGSFAWEPLVALMGELFGDWEGAGPEPEPVRLSTAEGREVVWQETSQTQIAVGYPSVGLESGLFYPLRLAASVLSGGMSSRLFTEVRERRGLVYSVSASLSALPHSGMMLCYAGTTPQRAEETERVLKEELLKMREGVTQAELDRGRTGILSSLMMDQESSLARTGRMIGDFRALGRVRGLDEVREGYMALGLEEVNSVLREHPAGPFTTVQLGPGNGDTDCGEADGAGEVAE